MRNVRPAVLTIRGGNMEKDILATMKKAGKPVKPGDIAKSMGVDTKEISKMINSLKKRGEIISPKRCYYSLPE